MFNKKGRIIGKIRSKNMTYVSEAGLDALWDKVVDVEKRDVEGIMIEAGCALGGSAIVIGKGKSKKRVLEVYDVFGMIPEPTEKDGIDVQERYQTIKKGESEGLNDDEYYGYQENLKQTVQDNIESFNLNLTSNNITLIKGLFQDTLTGTEPVALAHLDCDWYDSVWTCLTNIVPRLSEGGIIILDDYYYWSGCRTAVDDYFKKMKDAYRFDEVAGKLQIQKKSL